ncbi:MAG TPA: nuclease-related domain-containing protein [Sphingomicrobium sp.]|nr:nuclease-related domain-containing protein [Sphingomicrobium sp.]
MNPSEDKFRWMYEHPELLKAVIARSSGAIGELWVARKLEERGYLVKPANINARQCDLCVISPQGREFSIEVKTVKAKGAPYLVRQCPDETASIWFFVHAPRNDCGLPKDEEVTYRILTSIEVAAVWRARNRVPSSAPDIRWADLDAGSGGTELHRDRWDKLPA